MKLKIKRRELRELMKALSGEEDEELEYFKTKILEHLDKLEKHEHSALKKALMQAEELAKGRGLPVGSIRTSVGSIRTWKDKKYVKLANNKWARKYDKEERGVKHSLAALKKKIDSALTCEELMRIMLLHKDRFADEQGHPLPIVQELSRFIKQQSDKLERFTPRTIGATGEAKPHDTKIIDKKKKSRNKEEKKSASKNESKSKASQEQKAPRSETIDKQKQENTHNSGKANKFEKLKIGKSEKWLIDNAKKVGINLEGFEHEITNHFISHVMKHHSDEKKEKSRGQIAVTEEDFSKIPEILKCPDYAIIGAKRKDDTMIIYAKEMQNGTTLYFEEILDGKRNNSLRGKTLFKLKGAFNENKINNIITNREETDISKAKKVIGAGSHSSIEASMDADPTVATSAQTDQLIIDKKDSNLEDIRENYQASVSIHAPISARQVRKSPTMVRSSARVLRKMSIQNLSSDSPKKSSDNTESIQKALLRALFSRKASHNSKRERGLADNCK